MFDGDDRPLDVWAADEIQLALKKIRRSNGGFRYLEGPIGVVESALLQGSNRLAIAVNLTAFSKVMSALHLQGELLTAKEDDDASDT